jgi:antitoxin (DNA-binding transcriptional repressor) of toxin-antitoxin stability system
MAAVADRPFPLVFQLRTACDTPRSVLYTIVMSESMLTIEDAARTLPEVVDRIHASGESTVLTKSGKPVARIVPFDPHPNGSSDVIAFLRRWRLEYPDPDESLAEAIAESRKAVRPPNDPWQ